MYGKKKRKDPKETGKKTKPKKSQVTREKILEAARLVFAEQPYNAASIRMIGKEGGFPHALIRYYYLTKAELFEAVIKEICREIYEGNLNWLDGLSRTRAEEGLSIFLDRFLDFHFKHPEHLRIIMLNMTQAEKNEEPPGYHHLPDLLAATRKTFEENTTLRASSEDIGKFFNSFNSMLFLYLGSRSCMARVTGLDPDSPEYKEWIKDTFMFVFLPALKILIHGPKQ